MAFTYTQDLTVPRDFVRFHTGDTVQGRSYLSDEIIASLLVVSTSKETAVIAGLRYIITQLSKPDFTADWLKVSHASARAGYQAMLKEKQLEFGSFTTPAATAVRSYRPDSFQRETPTYTEDPNRANVKHRKESDE